MHDNGGNFLLLYDGTCDQTKKLVRLSGKMSNDEKWVYSSSGHHMFVSFIVGITNSRPGFLAKIHYGNKIKSMKICASNSIY